MDSQVLLTLEKRGYANVSVALDFSQLSPRLRNELTRSLRTGLYPAGWNSDGYRIFTEIMKRRKLPYITVSRGNWGGVDINLDHHYTATHDLLAEFQQTQVIAEKLKGEEPSEYYTKPYTATEGHSYIHIFGRPTKQKIENLREIAKTYAQRPEYVAAVAPIIKAVEDGQLYPL